MKITAHFDGGHRPKLGKAAYGYILRLTDNQLIWDGKVFDCETNNIAEYTALIECIKKAIELKCYHLEIYSDSQLVVNQVNSNWHCNFSHLVKLRDEALSLLKKIDYWTLKWIPRSENIGADWIVNYAFKEAKL